MSWLTDNLDYARSAACIKMPLCRSARGMPVCWVPGGRYLYEDPPMRHVLVAEALEVFEGLRREQHGASVQLPSLAPADWQLVEAPNGVLHLVPA